MPLLLKLAMKDKSWAAQVASSLRQKRGFIYKGKKTGFQKNKLVFWPKKVKNDESIRDVRRDYRSLPEVN